MSFALKTAADKLRLQNELINALVVKDVPTIRALKAQGITVNDIDITKVVDPNVRTDWSGVINSIRFLLMMGLDPNYTNPDPSSPYYGEPLFRLFRNDETVIKLLHPLGGSPLVLGDKVFYNNHSDKKIILHSFTEDIEEERLKALVTTTNRPIFLTITFLDLTDPKYNHLPDNSHIRGIVRLGPGFTKLPDGLVINSLDISNANITSFPNRLKILGKLTVPKDFFMSDVEISQALGLKPKDILRA